MPIIGTLLDYVRDQGEGISGYKRMHVMQQQRIQQFAQGFNEVSSDLLSRLKQTRDGEGLIPNIKDELFKWSLECEFI